MEEKPGPISRLIAWFKRLFGRKKPERVTEDEILSMVNRGHEKGAIDKDEAEMITNIFKLDDKQAQDIMTRRSAISGIRSDTPLEAAIRFMVEGSNSRYPVYEENIDNIIGVLYLKDAMRIYLMERFNESLLGDIPDLLRDVKFVPKTVDVDDLFRDLQLSRRQMAIVVDEYGETCGLVTMEDILEEIVGNIEDEYDRSEKLITQLVTGQFRISGKAPLEDVSKALDGPLLDGDYETLNGYLTEKLGHIPTREKDVGTRIEVPELGYTFRILSVKGTMIGWTEAKKD